MRRSPLYIREGDWVRLKDMPSQPKWYKITKIQERELGSAFVKNRPECGGKVTKFSLEDRYGNSEGIYFQYPLHKNEGMRNCFLDRITEIKKGVPYAVVGRIRKPDGTFLLVSRKEDPNAWSFPGGKIDENESPRQACFREILEETGIKVLEAVEMGKFPSAADSDKLVVVFDIRKWEGEPSQQESLIKVKWGQYEDTLYGPFKYFYEKLKNALKS